MTEKAAAQPGDLLTRPYERALIIWLALVQMIHVLDFVIIMPLGPQLMRVFSIDAKQFSYLVSAYTFSAAICGFIGSSLIDRFDRKKAILILFAGFMLGTLCCALAPNYEFALAARVFAGAFGGLVNSLVFTIVGDVIPLARRGKATGTIMASFSVSSIIGIPVGLALATWWDWHAPFLMLAVLATIMIAVGAYFLKPIITHKSDSLYSDKGLKALWKHTMSVLHDPNHIRAFTLTVCLMFGAFSVIPFISPYLVNNVGLKESDLPWIYFFGGIFTFGASRLMGILTDKYGTFKMFSIAAVLSLVPIIVTTNLPPLPLWAVIVCNTFFMVLLTSRVVPAMTLITSSALPQKRGSFMSLNNAIQHMASGFATLVAGAMMNTLPDGRIEHFNHVGFLAVGFSVFAIWLASRVKLRGH